MVDIWCVYVGDKYPVTCVYNLEKKLGKHGSFKCISDRSISGVETYDAVLGLPGWWQKIALFHYADKPSIYFDLDTVITGDVSKLFSYAETSKLAMPKNWGQSGNGGWQSSVMAWDGSLKAPYDTFNHEAIDRLWGDQEYLTEKYNDIVTAIPPELIKSYKYHCRGKSPSDEVVAVTFHGKPDYWECPDQWIKKSLSM